MIYVACRELNLGNGLIAKIGDEVDVSKWQYAAIVANVNMESIKKIPAPKKSKHRR